MILVTHDREEARSMGDRFVLLDQGGRVMRSGAIGDLDEAQHGAEDSV